MKVISCGAAEIREYITFTQEIYRGNPYYRDSLTPILQMILQRKSVFCTGIEIVPLMVTDGEEICAVCTLLTTPRMPGAVQMAFFEARPHVQTAVELLVRAAVEKCRRDGLTTILVGLNGHVNYGLGFLTDHFESPVCFGNSYNPPYYADYFRKFNPVEHRMVSYLTDMHRFNLEREARLLERVNRHFSFRQADLRELAREVEIYTRLNNLAFAGHAFYAERTVEEDLELFNEFKYFLTGENLLIAEKDGEPIGMMLWYPDFNQLIRPGKAIGVGTFVKNKLFGRRIDRFKIAEIAVVPQYQGSGAILGLFERCMRLTKGRYDWCETSWIFESNLRSKGFGVNWADFEYKHYSAFEIHVDEMSGLKG